MATRTSKKNLDTPEARIARCCPWLAAEIRRKRIAIAEEERERKARLGQQRASRVFEHEHDNGLLVIVADKGTKGLIPTKDLHDAAHLRRAPDGKLLPAVWGGRPVPGARCRHYPPSHILPSGVAIDSSFDAAHERDGWLREVCGVNLVGVTMAEAVQSVLYRAEVSVSNPKKGLRDILCRNEDHEPAASRTLERFTPKKFRSLHHGPGDPR